ncbi:MAG: dienelactone hydrolase family protein [bacterium]
MNTPSILQRTALLSILIFAALGGPAMAAIQTRTIEYQAGDTPCIGYLAWDDASHAIRPGVIIVHEFWGLNEYAKRRAREIAELGYVGFAIDMYGNGKVAATREEAGALAGTVRNDPAVRDLRLKAAYDTFCSQPEVDATHIGAMGYCFGGSMALQLAYNGLPLAGVVSFHGSLPVPTAEESARLTMPILICHGADDPIKTLVEFKAAMAACDADMVFTEYANAVHAFTNPDSGNDNSKGAAYNEKADKRSWRQMKQWWKECFGIPMKE